MKTNKQKTKSLPRKPGHHRKSAGFGAWDYQKDELRREAREKNVSVSYLINMKLFKDWQ